LTDSWETLFELTEQYVVGLVMTFPESTTDPLPNKHPGEGKFRSRVNVR
jgi:hypothetical protein